MSRHHWIYCGCQCSSARCSRLLLESPTLLGIFSAEIMGATCHVLRATCDGATCVRRAACDVLREMCCVLCARAMCSCSARHAAGHVERSTSTSHRRTSHVARVYVLP